MAFTYCTNCGEKFDDSEQKCPHCGHRRGDPVSFSEEKGAFDQGQNYGQGVNGQQPRSGGYGSDYGNGNQENQNSGQGVNGQQLRSGGYGSDYGNGNQENQNSGQGNGQKLWRTDDKNNPGGYNQSGYGQGNYGQNGYGQGNQGGYGGNQGGYNPNGYGSDPNRRDYRQNTTPASRSINVGQLVFSIINILLGSCCIGSILGIIALVFTAQAAGATDRYEEISKLDIAKKLNIAAIVITIITTIISTVILMNNMEEFLLQYQQYLEQQTGRY